MTAAFLIIIGASLITGVAIVAFKRNDQNGRDGHRKTYSLAFPSDLDSGQVLVWLTAISGTLRTGAPRLKGVHTIVFEVWVDERGIHHELKVPWQHADYVIGQLRSLVPGIRVQPVEHHRNHAWNKAVEVGESNPQRTLRIPNPEAFSASLLASLQALHDGEVVLIQWVVTPAIPQRLPTRDNALTANNMLVNAMLGSTRASKDEVDDRRDKLKQPNLLAVLRVATQASTGKRADHLLNNVRRALSSARTADNHWRKTMVGKRAVMERVAGAAAPLVFPAQLSATELSALIAWPIGSPHVAGLPTGQAQHLPAPSSVAREGRVFADGNFPGAERALAVTPLDSCKHWHIVGRTGSGKSVLMGNLMAQDMAAGRGVICVEMKGDLFYAGMNYVPRGRINDVVVLDVSDSSHPVGFNILAQGSPEIVASEVQAIFNHVYGTEQGVRMPEVLYHALITLMTTKAGNGKRFTFVDLMPLLWPSSREEQVFSREVIKNVPDKYVRDWWKTLDNLSKGERDKYLQSLRSRVWQLNSRAEIRNIIGQSDSSFDIRDIVGQRKMLLVNLAGIPEESASLIGALLINSLWHAIKEGHASPENPVSLMLDEFHHYLKIPISPETMLAEARSFGLAMHLAHQGLDQLKIPTLRSAVMNNAVNKVVFQRGSDDSRAFAAEFGSPIKDDDLKRLRKYEVVARVAGEEGLSPPITGVTRPPIEATGNAAAVRAASRQRYGRHVSDVETEIRERRRIGGTDSPNMPLIGDEEMGAGQ